VKNFLFCLTGSTSQEQWAASLFELVFRSVFTFSLSPSKPNFRLRPKLGRQISLWSQSEVRFVWTKWKSEMIFCSAKVKLYWINLSLAYKDWVWIVQINVGLSPIFGLSDSFSLWLSHKFDSETDRQHCQLSVDTVSQLSQSVSQEVCY